MKRQEIKDKLRNINWVKPIKISKDKIKILSEKAKIKEHTIKIKENIKISSKKINIKEKTDKAIKSIGKWIYNTWKESSIKVITDKWSPKTRFYFGQAFTVVFVMLIVLGIYGVHELRQDMKITIYDNKAEEYFYASNYSKAIEEYLKISSKEENVSWCNVKIAECYSVKGEMENSKKYIELAKKANLDEEDIAIKEKTANYIVFTEFMNKEYSIALNDGQAALKEFPKSSTLIKTMFSVYMASNDLNSASNLISSYPLDKTSAYDMAEYSRMLMIAGRWDEGITMLKSAWDIDKDEYKIYDVLSQSYGYSKDILIEKLTTLAESDPNNIAYKMWLAKIYSLSPDTSEHALTLLDGIGNQDAGEIEANLIRASILQNTNQTAEADKLLNNIIKKYPEDYRVLHTAGWYYLNKNDSVKALEYCKQSIVKNKDYPDNYSFLMPEILKSQNKSIEGEPYFRIALSKEPYNYNTMLNVANFYWITSQNMDKSIEYFKLAEIIKPADGEIKFSMANVYLNANKQAEAIETLKQCIAIDDSVPKYHRMLGTIYLTQQNAAEGIKETRLAYEADLEDILTLNNAGCYYITYEADLIRGVFNLQKAKEGINENTDAYVKEKINENYEKAKKLQADYAKAQANAKLQIPELTLFY